MNCEPVVYESEYYTYCGNCLTELEWDAIECEHCFSRDVRHDAEEKEYYES